MRPRLVHVSRALVSVGVALVATQAALASPVELQASWAIGHGRVTTSYHSRVELIGQELAGVVQQPASSFSGKVGPCAKHITFHYPMGEASDQTYYFAMGKVIVLAPSREHSGSSYTFNEASNPETASLLSEVGTSPLCKP